MVNLSKICAILFVPASLISQAKEDYKAGNYVQSLSGAISAYHTAQQQRDPAAIADAGNLIGLIRLAQTQTKPALDFFHEALTTNSRLRDTQRMAANTINIGLAFSDLHRPDSAIIYFRKAIFLSLRAKAPDLTAMAENHLGDAYGASGNPREAERHYLAVLQNRTFQSSWENSFAWTGMARIRLSQRNYRKASTYADRAYLEALRVQAKWDAAQALAIAHSAYWNLGDAKTAYQRLLSYKLYSDSLLNLEKTKALDNLFLKEKNEENTRLQVQHRTDLLIIALVSLLAIALVLVAFLIYRNNQLFKRHNQNKDRLFSIISHDLRSPLAGLHNTLQLFKTGDVSPAELELLAGQVSGQLESTTVILDSLLVWAASQMGGMTLKPVSIDLPKKIEKVTAALASAAKRKSITIIHEQEDLPIVQADADQVRIILQNLISNAIKYTRENGSIRIHYRVDEFVHLFIRDDGIGMPPETLSQILNSAGPHTSTYGTANEKGIGLGMQLVKGFAEQNHIRLSAESSVEQGTMFQLTFYKG